MVGSVPSPCSITPKARTPLSRVPALLVHAAPKTQKYNFTPNCTYRGVLLLYSVPKFVAYALRNW